MKIHYYLLLSILLAINTVGLAQAKELLVSVRNDKAHKIEEYNNIFLKKRLYFASRHRIVTIDTSLLSKREIDFTITPFEDVQITVSTKEVIEKPHRGTVSWKGEMHVSGLEDALSQLTDAERSYLSVKELKYALSDINLFISTWDIDKETGIATRSTERKGSVSPEPTPIPKLPDLRKNAFKSVGGNFTIIPSGKRYVLTPLKYSPKYHVIYEIDPKKSYPTSDDPNTKISQENKNKAMEYKQYLKGLPEEHFNKAIKGDL